jgi:hypothetical protein
VEALNYEFAADFDASNLSEAQRERLREYLIRSQVDSCAVGSSLWNHRRPARAYCHGRHRQKCGC